MEGAKLDATDFSLLGREDTTRLLNSLQEMVNIFLEYFDLDSPFQMLIEVGWAFVNNCFIPKVDRHLCEVEGLQVLLSIPGFR